MITLIHGDDIEKSRAELNAVIGANKDKELRRIDGRQTDVTALATAFGSLSLQGKEALVVGENLLGSSLKKPTKLTSVIDTILRSPKDVEIILWEGRELTKSTVSKLGSGAKVNLFKIPVVLFQFLDGVVPAGNRTLLTLYQKLRIVEADELIFYMLTGRVRHLLILWDGGVPQGLQPWQEARLTTQARHFTMEKLRQMYKNLLTMEYSLKSGRTPFSLSELIEQFLIDV